MLQLINILIGAETRGAVLNITATRVGERFDGIGAASASTEQYLRSYPPAQRDEILDLLFSPTHGGAALHRLKVEIGGDTTSTSSGVASTFSQWLPSLWSWCKPLRR